MKLLTNYAECFEGKLIPYSDNGILKIISVETNKTAKVKITGNEVTFAYEEVDIPFSCSVDFYNEMVEAAKTLID